MTDMIIVGAGTAGLTAAIYGVRAGKSVLVLEAAAYGGQIINTPDIENYPGLEHVSGFDFATSLYQQATNLGAEVKFEAVASIEIEGETKLVHTTAGNVYEGRAVILATGAKNRPLGVDREQELIGKGVSYCATCDGMFYRGKTTVINGGGNTAIEDAIYLSDLCKKVYVVHRRDAFRADAADVAKLKEKENVEFVLNSNVTKLLGEEKLTGVEVTDKLTGATRVLEADGLFIAIGQMPDNGAFANLIDLDEKGYIEAGESCKTKAAGIFTAGDCRTKSVRQLTTAASDGAIAATAAAQYIG